jgi:AbrB family looped-hinge helix DNA binding protein
MKMMMDRFGRVVVPKDIRDRLGLRPGVEIEIDEKNNELVLRSVEHEPSLTLKKGILVFSGKMTGDLRGAVKAHRSERLHKVTSGKKSA